MRRARTGPDKQAIFSWALGWRIRGGRLRRCRRALLVLDDPILLLHGLPVAALVAAGFGVGLALVRRGAASEREEQARKKTAQGDFHWMWRSVPDCGGCGGGGEEQSDQKRASGGRWPGH